MNKAKEVLNKIKTALDIEVKLETRMLEDGVTTIEADTFEEGSEVFIVMDEERVPLAIGEYVLDDGMALMVEQEGIIAMIGEKIAQQEEEPVDPEVDEDLANDKPKTIVETKVKETYFEDQAVDEVVETIESVEEDVLGEVSEIISDLTPVDVSEGDASEMAVAVVDVLTSTLEEMDEELKENYMKPKKKYGKKKMTEEEAEVIDKVEGEVIDAISNVVDAETPEEVTPEIATTIAEVITEAVQEIVADAPEELKAQLFKKATKKAKEVKQSKTRRELAKEKIAKLQRKDEARKSASKKRIQHNPEKVESTKVEFKYSKKRPESTLDRVLKRLYK